jgi:hypothetical protein
MRPNHCQPASIEEEEEEEEEARQLKISQSGLSSQFIYKKTDISLN